MEETYEALEAIEDLGSAEPAVPTEVVAHLEEELGDVLFQVFFHSVLAEEKGRFTLADVARAVHDKLVHRHPHVFGDASAETAEDVAARWEVLKRSEKGDRGVTGGIPDALPALALAAKLLRKAESLDMDLPSAAERRAMVVANLERLDRVGDPRRSDDGADLDVRRGPPSKEVEVSSSEEVREVGELLLSVVDLARRMSGARLSGTPKATAMLSSDFLVKELKDGTRPADKGGVGATPPSKRWPPSSGGGRCASEGLL